MKMKMTLPLAVVLVLVNLSACGPVKYVKTWRNPEAQAIRWEGKKIAAFAMTRLKAAREEAEQALVRELTLRGAQGVPGYTIVPPEAEKDEELAKKILAEAGITGAVVLQVVDIKDDIFSGGGEVYPLSSSYMNFWGFWDAGWNVAYAPGVTGIKTTLVVDTFVYSIDQDRLLWVGTSKTTNPKDVDEVVGQLVTAAGRELEKAGLLGR